VPCFFMAFQQPAGAITRSTLWLLPGFAMIYIYYSGVYATIQDVVEPAMRGTAMAVYFFAMYTVAAFGPVITGWISDQRARQVLESAAESLTIEQAKAIGLHQALYIIPILAAVLVLVLFAASRTVGRDHNLLQKWMESTGQVERTLV